MDYDPKTEITVTTGAMSGGISGPEGDSESGDEVIINEPCWTNYIQRRLLCAAENR